MCCLIQLIVNSQGDGRHLSGDGIRWNAGEREREGRGGNRLQVRWKGRGREDTARSLVSGSRRHCARVLTSLGCEMSPRVTATLCRKGNVNSQESRRQLCEGSCTAGVEEAAMGWVTRVASLTYSISFLCSTGDWGPSSGRCLPDIRIPLSTRDL